MYVNREYKQSPDLTEISIISGVLVKASINKEDPLYTMRTTEVCFYLHSFPCFCGSFQKTLSAQRLHVIGSGHL